MGLGVGENRKLLAKEDHFVWGDENILEIDAGDGCTMM